MAGVVVCILLGLATLALVPVAALVSVYTLVAAAFDSRRARLARALASIPAVAKPIVATRGPSGLCDEAGPLAFASPLRTWSSSWLERFRPRATLEVHGVIVREETVGGYRQSAARTVVAAPEGCAFVPVFVGRRWQHERRLAEVVVTRAFARSVAFLVGSAVVCVALLVIAASFVDCGMG
jgi:hypothetical protein